MSQPILGESAPLSALRRFLLVILLLGMIGTGAELLLIDHTEGWRQWIPLALKAFGIGVLGWHFAERGPRSTRAVRAIMMAFVAAGIAGVYFHFQGSAEFKLESQPNLAGMALFWAAIGAKAPPLLAPGSMVQLGLLGLAYTYKHPVLQQSKE